MKKYPDITSLLESKAEHRRRLAQMPFEEKIKIVEQLQKRREQIKNNARRIIKGNRQRAER